MTPANEAELAEAIREAAGPLRIVGGGTRPLGRSGEGEVLSTAGLRGITHYEPGALTLVARAGTPLDAVEAELAAQGQRLPFEPMDHRGLLGTGHDPQPGGTGAPTIGGVVATNASGPRRIRAGACRDSLIGVRFVDGAGHTVKSGGRVMKNVTGYDLVKLLAGSFGTLGVLSEVTFKLLPVPESQATLTLRGLDDEQAVRAMAAALGTPFEVTGAAHLPGSGTHLRIEGFAESVSYRAARLARHLEPFGAALVERDPVAVAGLWAAIRDVASFHDAAGDVWRVSVKPSDGPGVAARAGARAVQYDWGGGLVWLLMPEGEDLRARLADFAGHATLLRADARTRARLPVFHPEPEAVAALSRGLRVQFDPRGLFHNRPG